MAEKKASQAKIVKEPTRLRHDAKLRKKPKYKSFRLHKRVKHPSPPLPSWWQLVKKTFKLMRANAKNLLRFFLIYSVLYLVFVRGFTSPVDIGSIRDSFAEVLGNDFSALTTNVTVLTLMIQSTTEAGGEVQGVYQAVFFVMSALALIWLFRQQQAGNRVTMKDAIYRGMYPLVPFVLVFLVFGLQLIPAAIGNFLYQTVITNGLAINFVEQAVWLLLYLLLILLSAYLMTATIIGLYIVTLPEMTPLASIKKAKQLVQFRRPSVMRKLIGMALVMLILFVGIVFPALFVSAFLAQVLYFVLSIFFVPFVVGYVFVLYRELL